MPRPTIGPGPWREAIDYWLTLKNANRADLARAAALRPNLISQVANGHHVNTKTLERIAEALQVSFEEVLVSPQRRRLTPEDRHRLAVEAAELALHKFGVAMAPRASLGAEAMGLKQLSPRKTEKRRASSAVERFEASADAALREERLASRTKSRGTRKKGGR